MSAPALTRALAAVIAAGVLAGCGGSGGAGSTASTIVLTRPAPSSAAAVAARKATADPPHAIAGARVSAATQRSPALRHLQAVLVGIMRSQGPQTGLLVDDTTAGATLFAQRATVGRPPASVEKLYTTVASDLLLGSQAAFPTDILGTGHLGPGGVWHGNLFLRGDGDPTFGDGTFNRVDEDGYGPTAAQLVAQLHHDGIRTVTGLVFGDESRFDTRRGGPFTHYQPDVGDYFGELSALVYDHGATTGKLSPAAFAARELVLTMHGQGISARAAARTGVTPSSAVSLARVMSPPLSVLLRLMDVPSDDLIADLLAKQLGYSFNGQGTLTAGAEQVEHLIQSRFGIDPTIHDGSGLDKADRSSPANVVSLLRDVLGTAVGRVLWSSLPVVGESGTVQTISLHTPAQGHCVAKTGTLNNVTNLAGYCHAVGGHQLVFAVFIDGPGNWEALEAISRVVGAIAAY